MGKSRGRGVEVDTGALARGAQMAPGYDKELQHGIARSCLMLGEACGELSSAPGGSAEQRRDRRSGACEQKVGRDGGGSREVALAHPSHLHRG
jgi:hypothetical protein